jgi:serine/threonine protein kinase
VASFHPHLGMTITVGATVYQFMPHPLFAADMDEVFVIEGGEALIYQIQDLKFGDLWALKVTKPSYRGEQIERSVAALAPYASVTGLYLANRLCLTRADFPDLAAAYPELEYAVVMPWLPGRTWAGFLLSREAGERYTGAQALRLALACAHVLWELEAHHLAHTDIASGNVMLTEDLAHIELLDIENLYQPHAPAPKYASRGTPGYQHRALGRQGQWCPTGDRFAGAILLAEMLSWWDPAVRAATPEGAESLFQPFELQEDGGARWQAMRDAIWALCPPALALFDAAWSSAALDACPELATWAWVLLESQQ